MQTTEYFTCSIRLLHSALIGTLLSFAANSSGLAQSADRPIWQVGDTWTFRVTNGPLTSRPGYLTATRQDVIREARDGGYVMESTDVESDGTRKAPRKLQFTLDMNRLFKVSGQSDLVEAKMFAFPMQSGARWEADFPADRGVRHWEVEVVGRESIIVPAGTFNAFKIVAKMTRTTEGGGWGGWERNIWYAPEIRRYVKRTDRGFHGTYVIENLMEELLAFQLR